MNKLCIILSSVYAKHLPHFLNEEVEQDLLVVKSTLIDHQFIEIPLLFPRSKKPMMDCIRQTLSLAELPKEAQCHIVLNTHGRAGCSDIKHDCVIEVVHYLSRLRFNVIQISALQCEGMLPRISLPLADMYRLTWIDYPKKTIKKEADLVLLQKKLSKLELDVQQHFEIRGFEAAYEPLKNFAEVRGLLQGHAGFSLAVTTRPKRINFEKILRDLDCMHRYHDLSVPDYQTLSNSLSKILCYIKEQLFSAIKADTKLLADSPLYPLFEALCLQAELEPHDFYRIKANTREEIYRHWLKSHKIYSSQRLSVIEKFAKTALVTSKETVYPVLPGVEDGAEPSSTGDLAEKKPMPADGETTAAIRLI